MYSKFMMHGQKNIKLKGPSSQNTCYTEYLFKKNKSGSLLP